MEESLSWVGRLAVAVSPKPGVEIPPKEPGCDTTITLRIDSCARELRLHRTRGREPDMDAGENGCARAVCYKRVCLM